MTRPLPRCTLLLSDRTSLGGALMGVCMGLVSQAALAVPQGGSVQAGSASITQSGPTTTITQTSDRAVLDWQSFDIGTHEAVHFHQPSSQAVALNRVTGSQSPTQILGKLSATGQVVLVNPNGVLFGKTAQVDVAGLVASTADVGTADFMAGRNNFTAPGHPAATVENRGSITVRDAGLAAFVAPQVVSSGSITARLGKVQLAGADTFTLDLYGDGLIQLAVTAEQTKTLLENSGTIRADGGQITLTAVVARNMVDSVLTTSGQLSAATLGAQQGHIRLAQQTEDAASAALPSRGVLVNSGTVSASGSAPGSTGGTVTLSSQAISPDRHGQHRWGRSGRPHSGERQYAVPAGRPQQQQPRRHWRDDHPGHAETLC